MQKIPIGKKVIIQAIVPQKYKPFVYLRVNKRKILKIDIIPVIKNDGIKILFAVQYQCSPGICWRTSSVGKYPSLIAMLANEI